MKTISILGNKPVILAFILSVMGLPVMGQDVTTLLFGKENKADYIGQYNYNGKRKNGFGVERQKQNSLYIGDFSEDKISGQGMLIATQRGIANVRDAVIYVGHWRNGKKEGKGTCYDKEGKLIYEGRFENDKPINAAPNSATASAQRFQMVELEDKLYWGEMNDSLPDGFGLTIEDDGNVIYGRMKKGIRQGIGMIFYTPEVWEVGKWTDGTFKAFNNSKLSDAKLAEFKSCSKAWKKELRNMLADAALNFAQAGLTAATIVKESQNKGSETGSDAEDPEESISSGQSRGYYQALYNKWESRAEQTYKDRIRHKVSATTTGDGRVANSDAKLLRSYQKMMRDIRYRAQKEGFNIEKSKYETVAF